MPPKKPKDRRKKVRETNDESAEGFEMTEERIEEAFRFLHDYVSDL